MIARNASPAGSPWCFLLSSPRSGSTLISRVLDSHSAIASPCEICLPYIVLRSRKVLSSLKKLRQICDYYHTPYPTFWPQLLLRRFAAAHLRQLTEGILQREQKRTLVIKDPRHSQFVHRIEALCQDQPPRYVLLYRDVRAVALSWYHTLGRTYSHGFENWKKNCQALLAVAHQLGPNRCLELRFEDFQADPASQMARVSQFLGHKYEPAMLNYGQFQHADDHLSLWGNPKLVTSVQQGAIRPERVPKWLNDMELAQHYDARPDIVALNERLGYHRQHTAAA